jgi:hypothetical protein
MVAIQEIIALGQRPEYERGFLQFQHFMAEVKRKWEVPSQKPGDILVEGIRYLSLQVASDLLEENPEEVQVALDLIRSESQWQEEFEKICREVSKSKTTYRSPEIIIEKNGECISLTPWERQLISKEIRNLTPAHYVARMDTGRGIWEEELTEKDLIWSQAFPGQALELAADTGEPAAKMTREITLLNGELVIRIFPGTKSGRLELRIGAKNHD